MEYTPPSGPLIIVGAGGFGRECLDIVEALRRSGAGIEFLGFVDDGGGDRELLLRRGVRCLGPVESAREYRARYVIAIGDCAARRTIDAELTADGLEAATLVHPQSTLGSDCRVGPGVILNAGARVTTNVALGRHVQVHANASVGHDSSLDDFVSIFPGATVSGSVHLFAGVTVGTGANVLPGIVIGADSYVGAGAVVNRNVRSGTTVVGVPAAVVADPQVDSTVRQEL